jgi:hypothetical protein
LNGLESSPPVAKAPPAAADPTSATTAVFEAISFASRDLKLG